jgi:hypothetical protein
MKLKFFGRHNTIPKGDSQFEQYANIKGVFFTFGVEVGVGVLENRLRWHHSCKSIRFKQLIRDPLSV